MAVSMHLRASFPPKKQDDHATKWRSVTFIGRRGGLDALRLVAAHLSGAASPVNSARLPGFSISPIRPVLLTDQSHRPFDALPSCH